MVIVYVCMYVRVCVCVCARALGSDFSVFLRGGAQGQQRVQVVGFVPATSTTQITLTLTLLTLTLLTLTLTLAPASHRSPSPPPCGPSGGGHGQKRNLPKNGAPLARARSEGSSGTRERPRSAAGVTHNARRRIGCGRHTRTPAQPEGAAGARAGATTVPGHVRQRRAAAPI